MDIYLLVDNRYKQPNYYAFKQRKAALRLRDKLEIKGRGTAVRRIYVDVCPTDGMYTKGVHYCAECNGGE